MKANSNIEGIVLGDGVDSYRKPLPSMSQINGARRRINDGQSFHIVTSLYSFYESSALLCKIHNKLLRQNHSQSKKHFLQHTHTLRLLKNNRSYGAIFILILSIFCVRIKH